MMIEKVLIVLCVEQETISHFNFMMVWCWMGIVHLMCTIEAYQTHVLTSFMIVDSKCFAEICVLCTVRLTRRIRINANRWWYYMLKDKWFIVFNFLSFTLNLNSDLLHRFLGKYTLLVFIERNQTRAHSSVQKNAVLIHILLFTQIPYAKQKIHYHVSLIDTNGRE